MTGYTELVPGGDPHHCIDTLPHPASSEVGRVLLCDCGKAWRLRMPWYGTHNIDKTWRLLSKRKAERIVKGRATS